jgi:hypothetical protein
MAYFYGRGRRARSRDREGLQAPQYYYPPPQAEVLRTEKYAGTPQHYTGIPHRPVELAEVSGVLRPVEIE